MENLIEIFKTVTRYGISEREIFGDNNADRLLARLLSGMIDGTWKTDEEASQAIYGEPASGLKYRQIKHRLRQKLLARLFDVNPENNLPSAKKTAGFEIIQHFAQAEILRRDNARNAAIDLYEDVFRNAAKFHFSIYALNAALVLESIHGQDDNAEKSQYYRTQTDIWMQVVRDETEARRLKLYFDSIGINTLATNRDILKKVSEITQKLEVIARRTVTENVVLQNYRAQLYGSMLAGDYRRALEAINEAESFFREHEHLITSSLRYEFGIRKAANYRHLRCYNEAEESLGYATENVFKGKEQWTAVMKEKATLALHSGNYGDACDALSQLLKHNFGEQKKDSQRREQIHLFHGYFAYIVLSGAAKTTPDMRKLADSFDIYGFLGHAPILTKDKTGGNIAIIVLQTLLMLASRNIEGALSKAESLRQYRQIYLKDDLFKRVSAFLKSLHILLDNGFDVATTRRKAKKYLEVIMPAPENNNGAIEGFEPLPWDKLWEIIMAHTTLLRKDGSIYY